MWDWCAEAGLPQCIPHGLRKAVACRMADLGMSNHTLKAVGGRTNDWEVAPYPAVADQVRLLDYAITKIACREINRDALTATPENQPGS
jgi:hypothetical protein